MAEAGAPWQLECEKMEQRCGYLLTSGQWSDCTFIVGSETNQMEVPAHKLVLAMASPVFEAMFYGGLSEGNEPIVQIPDVQPQAFKALLQYIYTGNTDIGSFDMAWDLWYGAKKYMLPHLIKECNRYICSVLSPKNACRAYEFAGLFDEKALMKNCIKIISTNTKEVLNASSFLDVQLNTVMTVLSLDQLTVDSELDLFHAVARYAGAEQKRQGQVSPHVDGELPPEKGLSQSVECSQLSPASEVDSKPPEGVSSKSLPDKINLKGGVQIIAKELVRETPIRGAIKKLRFLSLSAAQFAEGPKRSDLLTEAESYAIILNIASTVSDVPMPTGFSECRERRQQRIDSVNEGPIAKPRLKPCSESRGGAATNLTTPAEIVRGLLSHERDTLEDATRAARHMTCADVDGTSENLTRLVEAGGILPLVAALHDPRPGVQYEAAWALTNIACDGEHALALVNAGAVPVLTGLLGSCGAVAEQAAWALGNIAAAGDTASGTIKDAGSGSALLAHMLPSTPSAQLAAFVRTYRILCQLDKELVSLAMPYIENLLGLADEQVLAETCLVLYHLAKGEELKLELFTPSLATRLTSLMGHAAPGVQAAALGAVESMMDKPELRDRCFEAVCLNHLMNFLKCGNPSYVKKAARVACFFLRTHTRIQEALDEGILEVLRAILTTGHNICKLNAAYAITNICQNASPSQLRVLAEAAVLQPFCRQLAYSPRRSVLLGLTSLLKEVEENTRSALLLKLREFGVPKQLMTVYLDSDGEIRELAKALLRTHFLKE